MDIIPSLCFSALLILLVEYNMSFAIWSFLKLWSCSCKTVAGLQPTDYYWFKHFLVEQVVGSSIFCRGIWQQKLLLVFVIAQGNSAVLLQLEKLILQTSRKNCILFLTYCMKEDHLLFLFGSLILCRNLFVYIYIYILLDQRRKSVHYDLSIVIHFKFQSSAYMVSTCSKEKPECLFTCWPNKQRQNILCPKTARVKFFW